MKKNVLCLTAFCICALSLAAQAVRDNAETARENTLPVTRIAVFSSGLAYYEHTGALDGPSLVKLPFRENAVNDALKSLVLDDPASANPVISYRSPYTLIQTLRSLKIDLSGETDIAGILRNMRGVEVEIAVPSPVAGKITGVEYRSRLLPGSGIATNEPWLSLYTERGIRMFNFNDINAITFKDAAIEEDLKRALDLLANSRNDDSRDLAVTLPGNGNRAVSLSYVVPAPVWKVSYRLDLGGENAPRLQGWAIVDNDGDTDWNNVELSLVAGRPASFIQNLYPPYYVARRVLPLAIAGAADAATHDQGYVLNDAVQIPGFAPAPRPESAPARTTITAKEAADGFAAEYDNAVRERYAGGVTGTMLDGAAGSAAGEQFEFTVKYPVSVARRTSAMLPLTDFNIGADKLLIFSGAGPSNKNQNPRLGAELANTGGMKLPAGPITVYDGGTYAGDALIEFWNEGEKRLISYGEDLSVTGAITNNGSVTFSSVVISGGVMTVTRKQEYLRTYTFKNNAAYEKKLIIEHPKSYNGAVLDSPKADEETPQAYRFAVTLPAKGGLAVDVKESRPVMERVTLLQLRPEAFLSYTGGRELPANAREALMKAVDLRSSLNAAQTAVTEAERRRTGFAAEQDRIRKNLEAAGSQTQQGQEYLKRLLALDDNIDKLDAELLTLRENAAAAGKAYEDYLQNISIASP